LQNGRPKLTIHSPHPSQPKNVSFSLRKNEDRIAQMTTDRAPSGVYSIGRVRNMRLKNGSEHTTTMASTNAYAVEVSEMHKFVSRGTSKHSKKRARKIT